jgi:hypothetical protein
MLSDLQRQLWTVQDMLYNHEKPFYRYCASGFPMIFADKAFYKSWAVKRAALEAKKAFLEAALVIEHEYPTKMELSIEA